MRHLQTDSGTAWQWMCVCVSLVWLNRGCVSAMGECAALFMYEEAMYVIKQIICAEVSGSFWCKLSRVHLRKQCEQLSLSYVNNWSNNWWRLWHSEENKNINLIFTHCSHVSHTPSLHLSFPGSCTTLWIAQSASFLLKKHFTSLIRLCVGFWFLLRKVCSPRWRRRGN